jgi:Ca2+-dependent lipid-binding protein
MTLLDERERVAITFVLSMDYIPVEKNVEMGQLRVDVLDVMIPGRHPYKDACCKFYLNEQMVFKTHAVKQPLQPAWNEFFEVEVQSRIDARFRVKLKEDNEDGTLLHFSFDNALIDLQRLEPCKTQDFTIQLGKTSGSIRLQLLFRPEWTTRARRFYSIS